MVKDSIGNVKRVALDHRGIRAQTCCWRPHAALAIVERLGARRDVERLRTALQGDLAKTGENALRGGAARP